MLILDSLKPYAVIGVGFLWSASLAGMAYWQNDAGHTAERVLWQAKDNQELREANDRIIVLENNARTDEQDHANRLNAISTQYQKELKDEKAKRSHDVAAARTGALQLRFNTVGLQAGRSETGTTASPSSGCNGGTGSELRGSSESDLRVILPPDITEKLIDLAYDSDEVVKQLQRCQDVIRSDRKGGDPNLVKPE